MPHPLAQYLDFANHHANATPSDIDKLCQDVKTYSFHSAFVNPVYIERAKKTGVLVGTVISFPLGQDTVAQKVAAANEAVRLGADELDVVPNIGDFKIEELKAIIDAARMVGKPVIVKFILDPGYLTKEELQERAKLIQSAGADFVKIGSGMGPREPTVEDIRIVRDAVGPDMSIKVAGGITTYNEAKSAIDAGANRIGTSHAIQIVLETVSTTKTSGE